MSKPSYVNDVIAVMNINNYKEYYSRLLKQKQDPNYSGKRTFHKVDLDNKHLAKKETKYAEYSSFKNIKGQEIDYPNPDKESVEQFLLRCGFDNFEGSSKPEHIKKHTELVVKVKPKLIVEIGFNTGVSALNFLSLDENIKVISFDILYHHYCSYAKMYVDIKYPGRHTLIGGDSTKSIVSFYETFNTKVDFIFIDGAHTLEGAYADLLNCYHLAHSETILVMDNVVPHRGMGTGVYDALLRAIQDDGIVNFVEHVEVGDYIDGFAVCKYNVNKEDKFKTGKINYDVIERRYICYYYTYKIQSCKTLDKLLKIKKKLEETIKKYPQNFDIYVIVELNRKIKQLGNLNHLSKFKKVSNKWIFE
ncbi:methyltransferase domain [Hokovirus HKV1]|uniref:Methyltransferase domain n=1 Tax=Hokovirus HKV1 TaxID=1977638 RepID=A0A1V0SEN8_9VIRU|nr:methyltransferase domain [Hokovirus HKV1]